MKPKPIVIYDFRVISWKIYDMIKDFYISDQLFNKVAKALYAYILNRGPDMLDYFPHTGVVLDDRKPYWRTNIVPHYKGYRKEKPLYLNQISCIGLEYVNNFYNNLHFIAHDGFEADDLAGAFVLLQRIYKKIDPSRVRDIYLYTVDSDWMQLVSNQDDSVIFCNTGPWEPRIRKRSEVLQWVKKRLKVDIERTEQIVDVKMEQGDKSDNLYPGTPRYLIDLYNPYIKPMYFYKLWDRIKFCYNETELDPNLDHLEKAKVWLKKKGINIF